MLVNIDGSPRRGVKVVIEGSGLELETNSNGEMKIPLVNIDSVVIVLKILDGGQVVLSDVELPADIAEAISQVRVDSGIAPVAGAPAVTATPKTPDKSAQTAVLERKLALQIPENQSVSNPFLSSIEKQTIVPVSLPLSAGTEAKAVGDWTGIDNLSTNAAARFVWENPFTDAAAVRIVFAKNQLALSGWDGQPATVPQWNDSSPANLVGNFMTRLFTFQLDPAPNTNLVTDYSACSAQNAGAPVVGNITSANGSQCGFDRTRFPFTEGGDVYFRMVGESASEVKLSPVFRIAAQNVAPTLSFVSPQLSLVNRALVNIPVTIYDTDSALTCGKSLTVRSETPSILKNSNITLGGVAPNCTLSLNPEKDALGSTSVTIIGSDGSLSATTSFLLTIVPPDSVAPVLTSQTPAANSYVSGGLTLTGSCEAGLSVIVQSSSLNNSPQATQCGVLGTYSLPLSLKGGGKV